MSTATRIVTDANGRIVEAADGAGELLAIEDRWLVGKPLAAFVAESGRRNFRTLLLDLAHGGGPAGVSLELRRRDGAELTVAVEAVAERRGERLEWLLDRPDEEPTHVEGAPVLHLQAPSLQRILARFPHGIVCLNSDLIIEYLNPAARVFVGRTRVGGVVPEPWPGFLLREFSARLFGSRPPGRALIETGSGRVIALDGVPAAQTGSAVLVLEDVTARERQRRAEHQFVANAAHELRTPIAAIGSALEVLQGGAKENPKDRDLFLSHIERECDRLGRLASALLLLARIQTGQETPTLVLVEVGPLLDELAAEVQPKEGVAVKVSCPPGVGVLADADLLRQALWNVVANAAAHTHEGEIALSSRDLGRVSEIEVRDTGTGMEDIEQERAFDRFFRMRRGTGGSFGLGLAIADEVVRALNGRVTLQSELGKGTTVRLELPSARLVRT